MAVHVAPPVEGTQLGPAYLNGYRRGCVWYHTPTAVATVTLVLDLERPSPCFCVLDAPLVVG